MNYRQKRLKQLRQDILQWLSRGGIPVAFPAPIIAEGLFEIGFEYSLWERQPIIAKVRRQCNRLVAEGKLTKVDGRFGVKK